MILPIFGTIRNTVKMAELNNKWEQKEKKRRQGNEKRNGSPDEANPPI